MKTTAMEYTYREIIKAKAAALAREAEFGSDVTIKLCLHDLVMFAKRMRRIGPMSLSYVYDEQKGLLEAQDGGDGSYPDVGE